ncbi:MAG: hypothetical protein GMKNLPBB_00458 [Myxococcota bacterium]|nr:hypothetical protein [Myxococcota bacterium]
MERLADTNRGLIPDKWRPVLVVLAAAIVLFGGGELNRWKQQREMDRIAPGVSTVGDAGWASGALHEEEILVLSAYAPWCKPCHGALAITESMAKQWPQVRFVKFNVDEAETLRAALNVKSIPTTFVLKKGRVAAAIDPLDEAAFHAILKKTAHAPPRPES